VPAKIDAMFSALVARKGSYLHLGIGMPPLLRVRGQLVPLRTSVIEPDEMRNLLHEIMTEEQRRRYEDELEIDFAYALAGDGGRAQARFRANAFHKLTGRAAVFRLIPSKIATLDDLACPPAIRKLAERRAGLCLVTGPTGSGKSTTLAAMLRHINEERPCHVLTIEDPIEFVHDPIRAQVTQRQIGEHAPSFAAALAAAGREDADVILVGELRTNETMKLALQLAGFGVLVFGTMHTNSAAATVDRVLNAFPPEEQSQVRGLLAECLVGIVAQQLLPTSDGAGRVAAHEILLGSSALSAIIREGRTFQVPSVIQGGQAVGMQTLDMALERLVKLNKISAETALEKAADRETLARALKVEPEPAS
jgi:twitching motility protein PilT